MSPFVVILIVLLVLLVAGGGYGYRGGYLGAAGPYGLGVVGIILIVLAHPDAAGAFMSGAGTPSGTP